MINKEQLKKELQSTNEELTKVISSFTDEQFNKIPFEGSWTGGQVADHLAISDSGTTRILTDKTAKTERDSEKNIGMLKNIMLDFNSKMKNPEFNTPSNTAHDKEKLIGQFKSNEEKQLDAIEILDLTETCVSFPLPNLGELTRIEWLYFNVYHKQRHTHQLKNILDRLS
jgi:hypothetical protein